MIFFIVLFGAAIFLALNMGASGFSVSFTPSYGSGIIKIRKAVLLYTLFLGGGALLIGPRVITTLQKGLISHQNSSYSGLIILLSASLMMFISNILKIPQSTSLVTVGAFIGTGLCLGKINYIKFIEILIISIISSILSFAISYFIMKFFYPPNEKNLKYYQTAAIRQNLLKMFILFTDCYGAFAIGSNNVANVISPLLFAEIKISPFWLIFIFSVLFGIGGITIGKGNLKTISKEIVPIGEISAVIVSVVASSFTLIASLRGLPIPYAQITTFSILGISAAKDGLGYSFKKDIVKKILLVWIIVPVFTSIISYLFHHLIHYIL